MSALVQLWSGWAPWLLLTWVLLAVTRCRMWLGVIGWGVLSAAVLSVPWNGESLLFYSRALMVNFSIPLVGLLLVGIFGRVAGREVFRRRDWIAAWGFGVVGALALYPSALGLGAGNFDAYALGWPWLFWKQSLVLFGGVTAVTVVLLAMGNRFGVVLLLALVGYMVGFQESENFWDYVMDPIYAVGALMGLGWCVIRGLCGKKGGRRVAESVVVAMVLAMVVGCSPEPRADLVFLNGAEPETLDPALITGQPEGRLANALFEGLLSFGKDGTPIPGAAESWEVSEDGRVYTFHLREGLEWSDGVPLTAENFVESWKRVLEPATASEYAYQLHYIKNARAFNEGEITNFGEVGVSATDARTLRVELENPTPFFLDLTAFTTLLPTPKHVIERVGDDWIKPEHLVGSGAYTLEAWRLNDRIRLRKNPRYWNKEAVALETIDVIPVSKGNTAFNLYASGQADLMMDKGLVPPALLAEIRKSEDFHASAFLGTFFLRFNAVRKPFADERVRRAFSLVVDKRAIVERITQAGELPASGLVPPGAGGYEPVDCAGYDPEEARQLLAEAGFPGGHGMPMITYLTSEGEMNDAIAVELQGMWRRELGVNVQILRQEWKVYLRSLSALDFDIARSSWVGDYPDPNTFLDMFVTGGGNNRTGWGDEAYDRLIAKAAGELDVAKRYAILREAERMLVCERSVVAPLYYYVGIQFYDHHKLGGIEGNVLDEHPLKSIFWKGGRR